MNKLILRALVDKYGTLDFQSNTILRTIIKKFSEREVEVTIQPLRKDRSSQQNRYYWGVVIPLTRAFYKENTGEEISADLMHVYHLTEILGNKIISKEIYGKDCFFVETNSTKTMSTIEFNDFKEKIQKFYSEKGLEIPDPVGYNTLNDFVNDL